MLDLKGQPVPRSFFPLEAARAEINNESEN